MHKLLLSFFLVPGFFANAQTSSKVIHHRQQAWAAYFNTTRITDKWGVYFDLHYRMTDNFADRPFQLLIRPGVTYFLKDNLRATAGYGLIEHYPSKGLHTTRKEQRLWQQIQWTQKYPRLALMQYLRVEERFNGIVVNDVTQSGHVYSLRTRYNFSFSVPLKGKDIGPKIPYVMLQNELFLSFGKNVVYNTFDQNRLFVGMGYQFTSNINAQLGYMNVYQQNGAGNDYFSTDAIRLYVFHTVDLRTKS